MALDFNIALGIRPAFPTAIADAFHGAPVDYCYEDFSPVAESFNVPTLPAWAIVTAAYTFTSDSRPNLAHVAVSFTGDGNMAGKHFTFCGCDAAQHERACWHVSAVKTLEEAALTYVPARAPQPFERGDAVVWTSPQTGARITGGIVGLYGDKALVSYFNTRINRYERCKFALANLELITAERQAA